MYKPMVTLEGSGAKTDHLEVLILRENINSRAHSKVCKFQGIILINLASRRL